MASKLDDIFNECYERMRSGESLESCLRSYPQYRAQLEPLLRTTFDIGRRVSYIQPRPEFKHWARVRLESAQRYPRQQTRAEAPAASTWLRHGWAVAVSVGIVLLLTTGSTMAASSQALPDQPLYPVKLATEQVRVALAVSDAQKAQVETDLANIRAAELEAMANADKTEEAAKAAERYNDQFEKALLAITKSAGTEPQPPVYVPPTVSTPPATATPPAVSTPPTVTTPPETTTPTETTVPPVTTTPTENATPTATTTAPAITTPPVTTTPTETTVPPVTTTPTENATPTATTTAPAVTTPTETTTPTENATPTATTTAPAVTTPTETTTPSTSTTHDESKATKTDRLRKSLDKSTSKSITALQDAKEKASEKDKHDWQKSIDTMKKSQKKSQDTTSQSDNVTGNQQGHDSTKSTNGYHPNR